MLEDRTGRGGTGREMCRHELCLRHKKCKSVKVLVPVVQRLDNTIQRIAWFVLLTFIHWIVIYPVDSVIQPSNNRGQESFSRNNYYN